MAWRIAVTKAFLDRMRAFGPTANPAKCATLATVTDDKKKTFYVDPVPFLSVEGSVVPALNVQETYRYLGVMIGASAEAERHTLGQELEGLLEYLEEAPLKPAQKVYTVIHHVCPRLMHRLILGKFLREKRFCQKSSCTGGIHCLSHMIQSCESTHRLRVKWHDRVADLVSSELEVKGYKVTKEPRIAFEQACVQGEAQGACPPPPKIKKKKRSSEQILSYFLFISLSHLFSELGPP